MIVMPLLYGPNFSFSADGKFQYPPVVIIPNYVKSLSASNQGFQTRTEIKQIAFEDNSPITNFPLYCFDGCSNLISIENLPENLNTINTYCFRNCVSLEDIVLPKSLTSLASYCFQGCQMLEEINIPEKITTIPSWCFHQCSNLNKLNIEGTITTLQSDCFNDCASLTDELVEEIVQNVTSYGTGIFIKCYSLTNLTIPHVAGWMFIDCDNLQSVTITGNLTTNVGQEAFENCPKLHTILFLDDSKYTVIDNKVFFGCSALKNIQLPKTLISIGSEAFRGCASLNTLELPETVTSLGNSCFYDCSGLRKISLSKNIKTIPNNCFYNCSSLEEINLENITTLGEYCFQGAFDFATINIPGNIITIGKNSFNSCKMLKIILEDGVTTLSDSCFSDCYNLETIVLPNSLSVIEQKAFYQDYALKEIVLPDSVVTFNSGQVFDNCTSLEKVKLSEQMTKIPYKTFYNCASLKELYLPDSVTTLDSDIIGASGVEIIHFGSNISSIDTNAFRSATNLKDIYIRKQKGGITIPTNKWGAPTPANITIHWLTSNWTFSSNVDLSQAKIFIEGNEVKNLYYESENVGEVNFEAYHPDYLPLSGTITLSPPEDQVLDLQFTDQSGIIFTIIPNVENCNITISYGNCTFNSDHVMISAGTELSYTIEKTGYISQSGTLTLNESYNLVVELVLEGSEG